MSFAQRVVHRPAIWIALALVIATAVILGVVAGSVVPGSQSEVDAAEVLRRSQQALAEQAAPGEVVHSVDRTYFRYGPAADEIVRAGGLQQETTVNEVWSRIGADGRPTATYAETKGLNGETLRSTITNRVFSEVRDASGEVIRRFDFPPGYLPRDVAAENRQRYQALIDSGEARIVDETSDAYLIEWVGPVPSTGNNGLTVPYVADIAPSRILVRTRFDKQTYRPMKTEHFAVADGRSVVTYVHENLKYERLSDSQVPPQVAAILGL